MTTEEIAELCHETNRNYCRLIGDNSQQPWAEAPEWQRDSAVNGVKFHLAAHQMGITPAPSASHDSWLKEKRESGWKYGPEKDAAKKEHPCFVAYDQLPPEQRLKDSLFGAIVKAVIEHGLAPA